MNFSHSWRIDGLKLCKYFFFVLEVEQKFERLTARANMPKDIALGVNKQSDLFVIRFMFDIDLP